MKKRFLALFGLFPLAFACSAATSQRQACYAQAETVEAQAALAQCPGPWSTCPERPAILAQLKSTEASCP